MRNFREEVREEGPRRIFVRGRTEEELRQSYTSYFFPQLPPLALNRGIFARVENRVLNPLSFHFRGNRIDFAPISGVVNSLDRAFLGNHTATWGLRFAPIMVGGGVAAYYLIDAPIEAFGEFMGLENAVAYAMDSDYSFRAIRNDLTRGRISRDAAEVRVRDEIKARQDYFQLVRLFLQENPRNTMEDIAPRFLGALNDPSTQGVFADLRYFFSPQFLQNPMYSWPNGRPDLQSPENAERIFRAAFSLNHLKIYGYAALPRFLESGVTLETLQRTNPAIVPAYREIMEDPFVQRLIAHQRRHPAQISTDKLLNLLMEDLEWRVRFSTLSLMGAEIQQEGRAVGISERRAHMLRVNNIQFN
jgi:hypothetical protein